MAVNCAANWCELYVVVDEPALRRRYACFNTILELTCARADDLLVFEKARYGRNDKFGAVRCRVPYDSKCEIDVQHSLNALCGGHTRCSLAINTAFFDDPCGYDEFLYVSYMCLSGTTVTTSLRRCYSSGSGTDIQSN